jgi:hypothetical protein
MAVLRLVPSQGPPIPIEVTQDRALVGREPTCDVVVSDGSVSRKHAHLERRGNGWAVVDEGSANGTFVDSQRITESELRSGQEVRFGSMGFRVEIEGGDDSATILTAAPDVTVVQESPVKPPGVPAPPPAPAVKPPAPPWSTPVKPPVTPAVPPMPGGTPPPAPGGTRPVAGPPPLPPRPAPGAPPPLPPRATAPPPPPGPGAPPPLPPRASVSRPPGVESMPPGEAPPAKKRGPLFWIGGGCCGCLVLIMILAGVIGGGVYFATNAVVEAVRAQIADAKKGDIDGAYARMTDEYRAEHTREDFAAYVARHPGLSQNTDSTFINRNVTNDVGTVGGTLNGGGQTEVVVYTLKKVGGAWKISEIEINGDAATSASGGSTDTGGGGGGGSGGSLSLETVGVDKTPDGDGQVVAIKVRATGFGVEGPAASPRADLVLDLETRGPGNRRIESLSRMELQSRDRPDGMDPPHVDFDVSVTIHNSPPGNYVARLTVRDQIGRDIKTQDVPFTLP